jgi:hypothetical protein
VRATLRGLIASDAELLPHEVLVKDFNTIIADGLKAKVSNPNGKTARQVCKHYLNLANEHGTENERKYLWIIKKRVDEGCLSELIRKRVLQRAEKTDFQQAIIDVYSTLIKCLHDNQPYF